jgi:aspartyl/asparaginyl beta-hydroxylase (cupin superfamily)
MMTVLTGFFVIGGIVFWGLVALVFGRRLLRKVLRRTGLSARLEQPTLMPYTRWATEHFKGNVWLLLRALGLIRRDLVKQEVIDAHRSTRLSVMKQLRDVMLEVDALPTVAAGKQAMGIESIFELAVKPPQTIRSPFTHPLQYPPYFLPGVPAKTFYEPSEFEWAGPLLEAYPVIAEELEQVLANDGTGFKAYMSELQQRLAGWNTFNFFFYGDKVEENCARCPRTTAVLESLPRFERDHIMFSALNPHSHIAPHVGPINGIIRAHLALKAPRGCYIKVGADERTWEEGQLLIFDDSFRHEVWNHSDEVRIVLFLNFWHPCFRAEEIPVLDRYRRAYEQTAFSRVHERNQRTARSHDLAREPGMARA